MLLRFEVSNHRSIMDPVELSMIAVDDDRPAARGFERLDERVLTIAGVYGPNASGKSNLLRAIAWLSRAVRVSLRSWDEAIPREPFKFAGGPATNSTFELDVVVNRVRYAYRLEFDATAVLFEGLYSYPERRRRVLFEREDMNLSFRRGLGGLSGTRELLTPTTLALSAARRFDEAEIRAVSHFIGGMRTLVAMRRRPPWSTIDLFARDEWPIGSRESALELLRLADLGIDDVQVHRDPDGEATHFQLTHMASHQRIAFDIGEESAGTRTWFALIGPMLDVLHNGRVLLFDEIDASLHPRLSAKLLELFQDPATNPHGAQLIFTTHDTSLLNHMNRDEVWLTEKGSDGATNLTALAEYGGDKVRRSLNLEKAYLQGRFGAVPELDQAALRRALGLATSGRDRAA